VPTPLSMDLRIRVLAAVAQGLSHRQVGERLGVSAASVSRWRALEREQGEARAQPMSGDRRSERIEAHGTVRNLVCGAIVKPMEGAYGNQEGHPGRFAGGA
jgi:transposase